MKFTVITLFPNLIEGFFAEGLIAQAIRQGAIEIATLNPREFSKDVHQTVDDRAFGGGDGMVMKLEPLCEAIAKVRAESADTHVAILTPQGRPWTQTLAREHGQATTSHLVLVCGRYAGIDQRFSQFVDSEISIGDFILNGGEIAACAIIESIARLQPGVLGNNVSSAKDSFSDGLLECPQFTRPRDYAGMKVPSPLLSGDHKLIREFTAAVSLVRTALVRPDLLRERKPTTREIVSVESLDDAELKSLDIARTELASLRENL